MCGIFGVATWERPLPPVAQLRRATNLLRHRGPDGGGSWHERGVFLGHRRLAVIDPAGGLQPMAGADSRFVITFNGEIYNHPELRDELRAAGASFRTASDTEVLLEAYARWGTDMVARLRGMFAFAIWDRRADTLLLARDRFGEKPLLVVEDEAGTVSFASEMGPLAAAGLAGRAVDAEALGAYLCLNYVPGDRTMLRAVRRLPPAEWRLYGARGLLARARYWTLAPDRVPGGDEAVIDALEERLDRASRLALRSDVPVGVFLSGGVDSSLVAHGAARAGRLARAYCVDFADRGFSEWPRATAVAGALDLDLVRVRLDASVLGSFLDLAAHLDDPLADSSATAVWTVAQAAGADVKVVLSGDGGDELFGGYLTYAASAWHARVAPRLPRAAWAALSRMANRLHVSDAVKVGRVDKLQRLLRAMPLATREAHFTWNGTWLPAEAARFAADADTARAAATALATLAAAHGLGARPDVPSLQAADAAEYLPNDILAKVDRATMAHGLESRAPLLDPDLAALGAGLPMHLRLAGAAGTKVALRRLCARYFGQDHAFAAKQGFSIPVHRWLRAEGRPLVTTLLDPGRVAATGLLDVSAVQAAVGQHLSGARAWGWELWGLMVLVAWHEARVASPPDVRHLPDPDDMADVTFEAVATGGSRG